MTLLQTRLRAILKAFDFRVSEPEMVAQKLVTGGFINTAVDRPWSEYFCCMLAGDAEYVSRYPVATKRVLRALLKSIDYCNAEPEKAARAALEMNAVVNYDWALEAMRTGDYRVWRDYDPEDSVRFYALRMNELGLLKATPNDIIAKGADWRFIDELRLELKG